MHNLSQSLTATYPRLPRDKRFCFRFGFGFATREHFSCQRNNLDVQACVNRSLRPCRRYLTSELQERIATSSETPLLELRDGDCRNRRTRN